MSAIVYNPSKDELVLKLRSIKGKPTKQIKRFRLWWDEEGNICALTISGYTEFRKKVPWIQLGGLWRGVRIGAEDIKAARAELLRQIEEKMENR
ncbi:MAG: hypothetical protein ABIK47_06430 [candidate division WOR-3 bacterium]